MSFHTKSPICLKKSPFFLHASHMSSLSAPFPFLLHSSFCPSITPFLTISPDPMLILILLPHGSITSFSHFCIYAKERGGSSVLSQTPKAQPNPPTPKPHHKYRSPKPLLRIYTISYCISFPFQSNVDVSKSNGTILWGAMRLLERWGKLFVPPFSHRALIQIENGVN